MADIEFTYKGKQIVIREGHPNASISVDGREFKCHHHHPPDEQGLSMWMCDEAYFASPDIRELAKHFADYGYMFDDPGRIVVDESGAVIKKGPGPAVDPAHDHQPAGDDTAEPHHEHEPRRAPRQGRGGRSQEGGR